MRIRAALIAAILGASIFAGAGRAEEAPGADQSDMQIILSLSPPADACPPEKTESIALKDLLKDTDSRIGKCVSTEGLTASRALFMNRRDAYMHRASSNATSARRRIGFYGSERMMKGVAMLDGKRIRATGLLFDCADIGAPGDLVLGYCHYTGGPVIALTSVERVK